MRFLTGFVSISASIIVHYAANADTIVLKSGDVLHGKIIEETSESHLIDVPYADPIRLHKDAILSVSYNNLSANKDAAIAATQEAIAPHIAPPISKAKTYGAAYEYKSRVAASGSLADGNTNNKSLYLDGEIEARNQKNRFTGRAGYNFGESEGTKDEENYFANLKADRFITDKWYGYGNAAFLHDDFQDLDGRYTLGAGLGYQFYDETHRTLSLEAGPNLVHEDYSDGTSEDFVAGRWAVDYEQHLLPEKLVFFHIHEGLVSFDDIADLLIRSETGLYAPVTDRWEARIQLNNEWDNIPASGREKFDSTYLFGVGYRW